MTVFVRSAVFVVVLIGAVGASPPASAGGAVFDFDRRYYVPGDEAMGHVSFGKGSVGLHMLDRGPFYAYLIPAGRWIDPPKIPRGAVPLGPMRIAPLGETCGGPCYRATVRFTVPDVGSGHYGIGYCNDPCTVAGVGELTGGGIAVYQSREEARTQMTIDRLRQRVSSVRTNHRQLKRQVSDRREAQERALFYARRSNAEVAERVEDLDRELAAARGRQDRTPWWAVAGWILFGVLLLANLGYGTARMRRRRRLMEVPSEPSVVEPRTPDRELEPVP